MKDKECGEIWISKGCKDKVKETYIQVEGFSDSNRVVHVLIWFDGAIYPISKEIRFGYSNRVKNWTSNWIFGDSYTSVYYKSYASSNDAALFRVCRKPAYEECDNEHRCTKYGYYWYDNACHLQSSDECVQRVRVVIKGTDNGLSNVRVVATSMSGGNNVETRTDASGECELPLVKDKPYNVGFDDRTLPSDDLYCGLESDCNKDITACTPSILILEAAKKSDPKCSDYKTKDECLAAGCYWYNSACHAFKPICEALDDQVECLAAGCYWYDGGCHTLPPEHESCFTSVVVKDVDSKMGVQGVTVKSRPLDTRVGYVEKVTDAVGACLFKHRKYTKYRLSVVRDTLPEEYRCEDESDCTTDIEACPDSPVVFWLDPFLDPDPEPPPPGCEICITKPLRTDLLLKNVRINEQVKPGDNIQCYFTVQSTRNPFPFFPKDKVRVNVLNLTDNECLYSTGEFEIANEEKYFSFKAIMPDYDLSINMSLLKYTYPLLPVSPPVIDCEDEREIRVKAGDHTIPPPDPQCEEIIDKEECIAAGCLWDAQKNRCVSGTPPQPPGCEVCTKALKDDLSLANVKINRKCRPGDKIECSLTVRSEAVWIGDTARVNVLNLTDNECVWQSGDFDLGVGEERDLSFTYIMPEHDINLNISLWDINPLGFKDCEDFRLVTVEVGEETEPPVDIDFDIPLIFIAIGIILIGGLMLYMYIRKRRK